MGDERYVGKKKRCERGENLEKAILERQQLEETTLTLLTKKN